MQAKMADTASSLLAGEPEDQLQWHETFRDGAKNMYRTSYQDMSYGREVSVKSDLPSGYGGHVPSLRHDVLFRNTAFDRETTGRRFNPNRDAFPEFQDQISGIPTYTSQPHGAKKVPTYGTIPHNGTTTMLKPPWGILTSKADPLNHRTTPRTTPRLGATPRLAGVGAAALTPRPGTTSASFKVSSPVPNGSAEMTPMAAASAPSMSPIGMRPSTKFADEVPLIADMPKETDLLAKQLVN